MFNKHNTRRFTPKKIFIYVAFFIAMVTVFSGLVMFLWNAILPEVAGVKPLSFWQAAGLLLLSKILLSGFGGFRNRRKVNHRPWKNKWMNMNHEERHEAKMRWKEHCKKRKTGVNED